MLGLCKLSGFVRVLESFGNCSNYKVFFRTLKALESKVLLPNSVMEKLWKFMDAPNSWTLPGIVWRS